MKGDRIVSSNTCRADRKSRQKNRVGRTKKRKEISDFEDTDDSENEHIEGIDESFGCQQKQTFGENFEEFGQIPNKV